jgi:hypothetical protein
MEFKDGVFYTRVGITQTIIQFNAQRPMNGCKGYWINGWSLNLGFNQKAEWREATLEELNALGDEHLPYSKYLQDMVIKDTVYTIKDLAEGRVTVINDGTPEDVYRVVSTAFPRDETHFDEFKRGYSNCKFFHQMINYLNEWTDAKTTSLPTQSVKVFIKEIEEPNIIREWLEANPNPAIHKQVEREAEQLMREFSTGATRNIDEDKLDFEGFLSPLALEEFAKYMHKNRLQADGKLRDSDNWQKGIPMKAYMKSLYRHFFDTWKRYRGLETPEDQITNLCGLMFNAQGMLHELLKAK